MQPADTAELPALRTNATEYTLETSSSGSVEVDIPFTYRNTTGRTVSFVNCNGFVGPSLEKRVNGEWVRAWSPVMLLCLSAPIVIEADGTYADTLDISAAAPGSNAGPQFRVEPEGVFRLVLHQAVHDYDNDRPNFGTPLPLEHRVSNIFELKRD